MEAITLSVMVGEDRRISIELPPGTPTGPAEVLVLPRGALAPAPANPAREAARAKLLAAGLLDTEVIDIGDYEPLSDEELEHVGTLPRGARPSHELVDEDRGPR